MARPGSLFRGRAAWMAAGAAAAGAALTAAALLLPPVLPAFAAAASPAAGGAFTYDGLKYQAAGLIERPYPGPQTNSGTYWIVSYAITDTASTPIAVPAGQALLLLGSGGSQIAADPDLSGAAPAVLNPGITFSSYDVFNVPAGASPAAYRLGFIPYQVVGSLYYAGTPVGTALPPDGAATVKTPVGDTYDLQNVFSAQSQPGAAATTSEQTLTIQNTLQTNAVAPDLTAGSFDPATSFFIVDFALANKTSGDIALSAGDFTLDFGGEESIAPDGVASLPGYVQATGLQAAGGVTVPTGGTFTGSLLFVLPQGTSTSDPELQFSASGQTRIVSLTPCAAGACPPVLG